MSADPRDELLELIHQRCETGLSPEQAQRLEELLRGNPEAQVFYLKHTHLTASLTYDQEEAADLGALQEMREQLIALDAPRGPSVWLRAAGWLVGLAAVVTLALTIWWQPAEPFAEVAQSIDATWDGPAPAVGSRLGESTLRLQTGVARIDFDQGASVTLEGPAEIDLVSAGRAFLRRGQATARVSEQGDFHLDTPALEVAGPTAATFGVHVDPAGAAELCVFEGQAEVAPVRQTGRRKQRLPSGAAIRCGAEQDNLQPMDFDGQRYQRSWPVCFGVLQSSGVVRFVPPGPPISPRRYSDDHHLMVFPESERITLPAALAVTATEPGRYEGPYAEQPIYLPAGREVRSYLLQFNPRGAAKLPVHRLVGSITFDRPVAGLIATTPQLTASQPLLGALGDRASGLELGDVFELSPDRRTLHLDWTAAGGIDQLRVLVAH